MVGRATWLKPSNANADMIYFVANNVALFFSAPCSFMVSWFACLVLVVTCQCAGPQPTLRSSPFLHYFRMPLGVSGCWAHGDRDWATLGP